jgi:hypothetical protein
MMAKNGERKLDLRGLICPVQNILKQQPHPQGHGVRQHEATQRGQPLTHEGARGRDEDSARSIQDHQPAAPTDLKDPHCIYLTHVAVKRSHRGVIT